MQTLRKTIAQLVLATAILFPQGNNAAEIVIKQDPLAYQFAPGAGIEERKKLFKRLMTAKSLGMGIGNYLEKLGEIEIAVRNGESDVIILPKIDALSRALDSQYKTMDMGMRMSPSDLEWAVYHKELLRKLKYNWHPPKMKTPYKVAIGFIAEKDGKLTKIKVVKSSGHPLLDDAAMRAVAASSPANPWPKVPDKKQNAILHYFMSADASPAPYQKKGAQVADVTAGSEPGSNLESVANLKFEIIDPGKPADMESLPEHASFFFKRGDGGHMLVDMQINGHPIKAIFDTGASAFFYKDYLSKSGIDSNKAESAGFARGWAGVAIPISQMPAEIKLGNLTRNIPIHIADSGGDFNTNLIGQDLIDGYQYSIDDKAGRVDLHKKLKSEVKTDSLYDIPCTQINSKDIIQVEINGKKINAFIDTGSFATIIDYPTAKRIGLDLNGELERGTGVGGSITMTKDTVTVRVGPIKKEEFVVRIGGSGGCCIGQDLMEGWRYKVDREEGLLHFFH